MLGNERLGELELRLHDRQPVLLEHGSGGLVVSEGLPLSDKLCNPSSQLIARRTRLGPRVPHIHMLQSRPIPI
jgi:hypothetical protein